MSHSTKMKTIKSVYTLSLLLFGIMLFSSSYAYSQNVGRWEKLGERTVNLTLDRDVIRCSHKGAFSTLRFHVDKAPVSFLRVLVRYANGTVDDLNFSQLVRPGGNSRYLDLRGSKRVIREITVYYKAEKKSPRHSNHAKKALVSVWGRH